MDMEKNNLLGVLIEARIDSRRRLVAAILEGRVRVNNEIVTVLRHPVDRDADQISIDGQPVELTVGQMVYLMLNKPAGVLSSVSDDRGRQTVLDLIPEKYRQFRLYPAGRLDIDTTGLLLLTNDGKLTHHLTHPGSNIEKEYLVQVKGELSKEKKGKLEKGIQLEDGLTAPAVVKEINTSPPYNYSITIHEGRKRQVRRMFLAVGHRVLTLKRVRIGTLRLGNLGEGEVRELGEEEVGQLMGN